MEAKIAWREGAEMINPDAENVFTSLEWVEGKTESTHICRNCGTKYYTVRGVDIDFVARCPYCGSVKAKGVRFWDKNNKNIPEERMSEAVGWFIYIIEEDGTWGPHGYGEPDMKKRDVDPNTPMPTNSP
jgi:DNA-directed RNA polymerase subunit RPC12/RpoP